MIILKNLDPSIILLSQFIVDKYIDCLGFCCWPLRSIGRRGGGGTKVLFEEVSSKGNEGEGNGRTDNEAIKITERKERGRGNHKYGEEKWFGQGRRVYSFQEIGPCIIARFQFRD